MPASEFGLAGLAAFFAAINVKAAERVAIEAGAKMIADEAKRVLGTYDYGWQQLADATKADRLAQGYSENEPGLRSGEMRDSIQFTVISDREAEIGSDNDKMVYFELGTATQPARPTLAGAAAHKGEDVADMVGAVMTGALAGNELGEILRIIGETAKHVKDTVAERLPDDDDK